MIFLYHKRNWLDLISSIEQSINVRENRIFIFANERFNRTLYLNLIKFNRRLFNEIPPHNQSNIEQFSRQTYLIKIIKNNRKSNLFKVFIHFHKYDNITNEAHRDVHYCNDRGVVTIAPWRGNLLKTYGLLTF